MGSTTSGIDFDYTDTGLTNGLEYFYVATSVYDDGQESGYSNQASATPMPFEAPIPENLTANPGDSSIILEWDELVIEAGPGDPCVTSSGQDGFIDCDGLCFEASFTSWLGDGFCDDGAFGIDFVCEEWDFDEGDCDGDSGMGSKPIYEASEHQNQNREEDFVGYKVYRSLTAGGEYSLIHTTEGQTGTYTDTGLTNGMEYYYVITSQFEETESAYSNEDSASPMGTVILSMDGVSGAYNQGETFEISVYLENAYDIAGIEIHIADTPESVTMTNVSAGERLEGLGNISQSDFNGSNKRRFN